MEEKLELADQKVTQLSKLPEVQHELTQVSHVLEIRFDFFNIHQLSQRSKSVTVRLRIEFRDWKVN